jgi:hypothetical protein
MHFLMRNTPLSQVRLLAQSGTVTVRGFFYDRSSVRVGTSFEGTVDDATPSSLAAIAGLASLPEAAVAAVLTHLSGPCYADAANNQLGDFSTNAERFLPVRPGARPLVVGRADGSFIDPLLPAPQFLHSVTAEFTRPADVNNYAAKDVVSDSVGAPTLLVFEGIGMYAGGSGYIVEVGLETDKKDDTGLYRVHLYHTAPAAVADNAPFPLLYANRLKRVGSIDIPALTSGDAGTSTSASGRDGALRQPFLCQPDDADLYGILERLTAGAPASAQKFAVTLRVDLGV